MDFSNIDGNTIVLIVGWVFVLAAFVITTVLIGGMVLSSRKNKPKVEKVEVEATQNYFGKPQKKRKATALIVKGSDVQKESQVASVFGAPQTNFGLPSNGGSVVPPPFDTSSPAPAAPLPFNPQVKQDQFIAPMPQPVAPVNPNQQPVQPTPQQPPLNRPPLLPPPPLNR